MQKSWLSIFESKYSRRQAVEIATLYWGHVICEEHGLLSGLKRSN